MRYITMKTVSLNNHCPVCYSTDGLELTFKQKLIENYFFKSITSKIKQELNCSKCKSTIYPVQWTNDIDQVFEYHQKAFSPKQSSTQLKKTFWMAVLGIITILIGVILIISLAYK